MSSRRDSRVHIAARQNDALLEFENFKRKYLLVNKHITKLNSTLSVRVEELNTQVSTLYVENLRLRASEISLLSQLKKERKKSQLVMDETENAVGNLMEHLTKMRTSMGIRNVKDSPSSPPTKRKLPSPPVQPPRETVRLVRSPGETITQIRESDEEADEDDDTPTRTITTRRPSASRLPLPLPKLAIPQTTATARFSTIPHINLTAEVTKRKPARRKSGLLTAEHHLAVERAPSPLTVPVRRSRRSSIEREDEEREVELEIEGGVDTESRIDSVFEREETSKAIEEADDVDARDTSKVMEWMRKTDRKGKARESLKDLEREGDVHSNSERESSEGSKEKEKRRFGIKDVTNSPRKCPSEFLDEKHTGTPAPPNSNLTTPSSTNTELFDTMTPRASVSPFLSAASTPVTDNGSETGDGTAGRERRTRKSVNYAEPKLNTKMRKPDPPPDSVKLRTSAGGTGSRRRRSIPTPNPVAASDDDGDADAEGSGPGVRWMEGRRKTVHNPVHSTPDLPLNVGTNMGGDAYGVWGDEARRHSMAV
ncbi:hypothetical protein K439DRAFT_1640031 [Ramaria rubella]|nr:hypothetical protein K439DRAFT_1640031 [Ramaria rubella]